MLGFVWWKIHRQMEKVLVTNCCFVHSNRLRARRATWKKKVDSENSFYVIHWLLFRSPVVQIQIHPVKLTKEREKKAHESFYRRWMVVRLFMEDDFLPVLPSSLEIFIEKSSSERILHWKFQHPQVVTIINRSTSRRRWLERLTEKTAITSAFLCGLNDLKITADSRVVA